VKPEQAFGLAVRELRRRRAISQERLALESQLDRTFISLLERGLRQPSLTTILQIAKALEVTPEELVASVTRMLAEKGGGVEAS
jgi:transcriptional regulator with XRE-family HTH domain